MKRVFWVLMPFLLVAHSLQADSAKHPRIVSGIIKGAPSGQQAEVAERGHGWRSVYTPMEGHELKVFFEPSFKTKPVFIINSPGTRVDPVVLSIDKEKVNIFIRSGFENTDTHIEPGLHFIAIEQE